MRRIYLKLPAFVLVLAGFMILGACELFDEILYGELVSISVTQLPSKTVYYVNDTFSSVGLVVKASYSDGTLQDVTGYSLSKPDMTAAGSKTVTVTYKDQIDGFDITVNPRPGGGEPVFTSITVTQPPAKTIYYVNEAFDPSGLVVKAVYSDGSSQPVAGYSLSNPDMSVAGPKTVTVTYNGQSAGFTITVNSITLTSITVTQYPSKIIYYVNEAFDPSGLVVKAVYSDGSSQVLAGGNYSLSNPDMTTAGTKTITVTFGSLNTSFTITVNPNSGGDDPVVTSISVTQPPAKISYDVNEAFNPSGLVITAAYNNGTSETVTGYSLSTPDMSTTGTKTITVTFGSLNTSFTITVNPNSGGGELEVIIY